jgi:hypothetical protein
MKALQQQGFLFPETLSENISLTCRLPGFAHGTNLHRIKSRGVSVCARLRQQKVVLGKLFQSFELWKRSLAKSGAVIV